MLHIAICDDDEQDRKILERYCQRLASEKFSCLCDCYASGTAFLQAVAEKSKSYDILLLDIEMEGADGIAVKNFLEQAGENIRILFITNHTSYAKDGYGEKVYDYLTKPIVYQELEKDIERILNHISLEERFEILQNAAGYHKILWKNIKYIKAAGKYVYFHLMYDEISVENVVIFDDRSYHFWKKRMDPEHFTEAKKGLLIYLENVKKISRKDGKISFEDNSTEKASLRKITTVYQALLDYRYSKENRRFF